MEHFGTEKVAFLRLLRETEVHQQRCIRHFNKWQYIDLIIGHSQLTTSIDISHCFQNLDQKSTDEIQQLEHKTLILLSQIYDLNYRLISQDIHADGLPILSSRL